MINWWLRQVACLPSPPPGWHPQVTGAWTAERGRLAPEAARRAAALDAASSFGATVGHLVAALRKLSAANTPEENGRKLYRCMKGATIGSFWLPDAQGMVCAVDPAFMSTALAAKPFYMDAKGKPSVLLELRAGGQDDTGYHCGAEVAFLSQFQGEQEVRERCAPPLEPRWFCHGPTTRGQLCDQLKALERAPRAVRQVRLVLRARCAGNPAAAHAAESDAAAPRPCRSASTSGCGRLRRDGGLVAQEARGHVGAHGGREGLRAHRRRAHLHRLGRWRTPPLLGRRSVPSLSRSPWRPGRLREMGVAVLPGLGGHSS